MSKPRRLQRRTFGIGVMLLLVTVCVCLVAGRQYYYERHLVNEWVDLVVAQDAYFLSKALPDYERSNLQHLDFDASGLTHSQQAQLLIKALGWQPTEKRRSIVLQLLAEHFPGRFDLYSVCLDLARDPPHEDLRLQGIRLSSIYRKIESVRVYEELIDHDDPQIVAAAIDAIGFVHQPAFDYFSRGFIDIGLNGDLTSRSLVGEPPITLFSIVFKEFRDGEKPFEWEIKDKPAVPMPHALLKRIRWYMVNSEFAGIRMAAARAMSIRPPSDYQLRVAEWGVWIADGNELRLAEAVLDEIPPFVHRTNDSVDDIANGRVLGATTVTKPIIHFTVDQPLAVDLSVLIDSGRPWFGYPMPDDYSVRTTYEKNEQDELEQLPTLKNASGETIEFREGYPWLDPDRVSPDEFGYLKDAGFRWQSLIVLPERSDWMDLQTVDDPKYQWWSRLREVPCSWVSSRGEAERFVYYDGPTTRPSPITTRLLPDALEYQVAPLEKSNDYAESKSVSTTFNRRLIFIDIGKDGVRGWTKGNDQIDVGVRSKVANTTFPLKGVQVETELRQTLVEFGLIEPEADGLIDGWRAQFLETPGKRLLYLFDKETYDQLCPIEVSPAPTEMGRVGIVLTEFGVSEALGKE